ncbi:Uu.00g016320.m01.CDS01 [Anthostomella pinea]|uniref:Uu.00g016320.m01.CDS01 n=1 Tax=Anthostomella pinea TaxID=933095 RepID=A0AAI8VZX3_9PEZI|nr:Uu.00g016320.m01.CDS01 [Anthostomella pinea]
METLLSTSSDLPTPIQHASLLSLPNEIILSIVGHLSEPDLASLSATNKRLHDLADFKLIPIAVKDYPYVLCWASEFGYADLVRRLLLAGADPNRPYVTRSPDRERAECNGPAHMIDGTNARMVLDHVYSHDMYAALLKRVRGDNPFAKSGTATMSVRRGRRGPTWERPITQIRLVF